MGLAPVGQEEAQPIQKGRAFGQRLPEWGYIWEAVGLSSLAVAEPACEGAHRRQHAQVPPLLQAGAAGQMTAGRPALG